MEYEEVIGRLLKRSLNRTEENVEALLSYLYYEEEDIEELLPIEYEDIENLLGHAKQIEFDLDQGSDLKEALSVVMKGIDFSKPRAIDTMMVKFIGGPEIEIEDVYEAFSALEFGMNSTAETDVLIAATRDNNMKDSAIAIVLIASDGEF